MADGTRVCWCSQSDEVKTAEVRPGSKRWKGHVRTPGGALKLDLGWFIVCNLTGSALPGLGPQAVQRSRRWAKVDLCQEGSVALGGVFGAAG